MNRGINFAKVVYQHQALLNRRRRLLYLVPVLVVLVVLLVTLAAFLLRLRTNRQVASLKGKVNQVKTQIKKLSKVEAQEYYYYLQVNTVVQLVAKRKDLVKLMDKAMSLADRPNRGVASLNLSKSQQVNGVFKVKSLVDLLEWQTQLQQAKSIESFEVGGLDEASRVKEGSYNFMLKVWWRP